MFKAILTNPAKLFNLTGWRALGSAFLLGFAIRLIPELLSFPSPIGFDTVDYAFVIKAGVVWSGWTSFFTSSWLLYAISVPFGRLGIDPFALLKVLGPILFGLNVAGVFWFARKALGWNAQLSVLACGFFALQLASLRISWDLLRNCLGMGLVLFALSFVGRVKSRRGLAGFALLGVLAVFAHEYASVTLLGVVLGLLIWRFVGKRVDSDWRRLFAGVVPALAVFSVGLVLRFVPAGSTGGSSVIDVGDAVRAKSGGVFFLVDYLSVRSGIDFYGSYFGLVWSVLLLFVVLYGSVLLLVLKGFFRDEVLTAWTGLLLVGGFGCLVVPFCALEYWHRWMFMLVYPFTYFAVNGLRRVWALQGWGRFIGRLRFSRREARLMVLVSAALGISYLFTPVLMNSANVSISSVTATYTYFSTNPTVPYQDVSNVADVMRWLNVNMDADSCVALHHAFLYWGRLDLDDSHIILHFELDADRAVEAGFARGYSKVFFVWWNVPIGWYGVEVPVGFVQVFDSGRLSVYEYVRV